MSRKRTILLAALSMSFTASSALFPEVASAQSTSVSTRIVNEQSGLAAFVAAPPGCHDFGCLNGSPLRLAAPIDSSVFFAAWGNDGVFQIHWTLSKCLDLLGHDTTNGTPVVLNDCNGSPSQNWIGVRFNPLTPASSHEFALVNRGTGTKCLDARNPAFPNPPPVGALLQIWSCFTDPNSPAHGNQTWLIDLQH
ncbi:RICIN domain-containing protein [Kitasatospora sp. NPDC059408]|uniref:RICIN domain-containing protein n=1 Tax=Kitasatospora sp. NPDC059408 TaxID=3346823 RepID=UPI003675BF98